MVCQFQETSDKDEHDVFSAELVIFVVGHLGEEVVEADVMEDSS